MKIKVVKILSVVFLICSFSFFFLKNKRQVQNVTFKNIEALAIDEEVPLIICYGVGSVDCDGRFYKYRNESQ